MAESSKPVEGPSVECEVCLTEVPKSEIRNAETEDYVLFCCGVECYGEWRRGHDRVPHQA